MLCNRSYYYICVHVDKKGVNQFSQALQVNAWLVCECNPVLGPGRDRNRRQTFQISDFYSKQQISIRQLFMEEKSGKLEYILTVFEQSSGKLPINKLRRLENRTSKSTLNHGTYFRQYPINRCARKEQPLMVDLFNAFAYIESGHKQDFFLSRKDLFLFVHNIMFLLF